MNEAGAQQGGPAASIELRLNGAAGADEAAGAVVRTIATASGVRPERATRLRVVVEELVREAFARPRVGSGDDVVVRAGSEAGQLVIEVSDLAAPVAASESRRAASRRLAALGFVDELQIRAQGREGNRARCALDLEPMEADLGGEEVLGSDPPRASEEEVAALEIRAMKPADAMALVRCVYRSYGYSYKTPMLYEPRHIATALRSGALRSVVAAAPDGDVVGHCALFKEVASDPVPEAGKMLVDPRYRGHHLSGLLAEKRLEIASDREIPGFWAQAVTNHPASQREVLGLGGFEVGLLIGGSPGEVKMAGFENPNEGRRTLLVTYTPLRPVPRAIHVAPRHAGFVAELAERLGLERTIASEIVPGSGSARVTTTVIPDSGLAHMRVIDVGEDLKERIADEVEGLDSFDLGAVHLDLPLSAPGSARAAQRLETMGFSIAAWIPDFAPDGDVLRLQRVGSHPVDTEHVVCARPEGEAVRDYVVAEWHRVRRGGDA